MNLLGFMERLSAAVDNEVINDDALVVILFRNPDFDIEADEAFDTYPVTSLRLEEEEIGLIVGAPDEPGMDVASLKAWVADNISRVPAFDLYVAGGSAASDEDLPAVATVSNPVLNMFGVMAYFPDCEQYLYDR